MEVPQGLFVLLMALLTAPEGSMFCNLQIHVPSGNPIIKLSSPLTLNCSSSCPSGKVKWKLMQDSIFARIKDHGHYSTMEFNSITEDDESFTCEEKSEKKTSRTIVKLYQFSGPTITAEPKQPETGRPFQLKCTVKIHPELSAKLELKHGSRVLTNKECVDSAFSNFQDCEISAEEIIKESVAQYKCEAVLHKDSSRRNESASLEVILRGATALTDHPTAIPTISPSAPPTQPKAAVVTGRVTVQTEQPYTHPSSAFKRSAAVRTSAHSSSSSSSSSSSAAAAASASSSEEQSSSTAFVPVIICLVIVGLVILVISVVLYIRFKKHKEAQPQEKEEITHFNNL